MLTLSSTYVTVHEYINNRNRGIILNKKQKGLKEFIDLCLDSQDENQLAALFDLFFTEEEKSALALRFLLVRELLKQENSQRAIAKRLNISIAKITRGSNELKRINKTLLKYLEEKLT